MSYTYRGKKIDESKVWEILEEEMDANAYESYLDEYCDLVEVDGKSYHAGRVMRLVDPVRFHKSRKEHIQDIVRYLSKYGGNCLEVPGLSADIEDE